MSPNQTLVHLFARLMPALDGMLASSAPDFVLVQGDTTSALCAALCAFLRNVPVGHVEAGLRTHLRREPFPEELNRKLTADVANIHFAPTQEARANLLAEGIAEDAIFVTGNTAIDAVGLAAATARIHNALPLVVQNRLSPWQRMVLITAHRRESFGAPMGEICGAVSDLAGSFPDVLFVFPAHLNPNVKGPVSAALGDRPNVVICEPQGYLQFVALMDRAHLILTDSGGVQEEAPSLRKPVLILRDRTERPEVVTVGAARLVGTSRQIIVTEATRLIRSESARNSMMVEHNPCGDGQAADRIAQVTLAFLDQRMPIPVLS